MNTQQTYTYSIKKAGKAFDVDFGKFSSDVQENILQVGLGRILNDLVAGAKTQSEAIANVNKKLDAWKRGEIRAARIGDSDPVATEALRIAIKKVRNAPKFLEWLSENGLKMSSDEAVKKLRELAQGVAKREDVIAEARKNVQSVEDLDIDLDI